MAPALAPAHALSEWLAWLGSWLDPDPVRNLTAPGGHTVDPDGEPAASGPEGGPILAPEGGGTMDPDG